MGNTLNEFGKPIFDDIYSFPQDSQDAVDFADVFANIRVGTSTERQALAVGQQRAGMLWSETDTSRVYQSDGAGWTLIVGNRGSATPTVAAGWSSPSQNIVVSNDMRATLTFNAIRATTSTVDSVIVTIPEGFRAGANAYGFGWGLLGGASSIQCWYDASVHQVKMRQALSAGQSLALTMSWPITG